jgi:valyl-tRNA synthetase
MDKAYNPASTEQDIYKLWEQGGYFSPKPFDKAQGEKKPFTVILPPPNANADLHLGHAMYVIEDIMIRYHRMKGDPTLWLPGADHAGFETQFVYEKMLAKQDKSRFDFDRETLYKNIWDFVQANRGNMETQLKRLGFSLDWSRNIFTLDPKIISIVYKTFKKLYDDGLVYRGARLVNYCTKCGTGFSDLEVKHVEQVDPLYYMKYGPFILATVRPETKFGDTAVAVNPKDKRWNDWVGKEVEIEGLIGKFKVKVVADSVIDPKFGTGVAKVTPAHDMTDFEIGKRHNLPMKQVIGFDGKLTELCGPYAGLRVKAARVKVAEDMKARGMIDHIDDKYTHVVSACYKCNTVLEPLPMSQWFISVRPLADTAIKAIKEKKIAFVPKRFEKHAVRWLTDFHDWNISRQIVWGIRVPAWKCLDCSIQQPATRNPQPDEQWIISEGEKPTECPACKGTKLEQDTDTFDTWFSSGQWPFATLLAGSGKREGLSEKTNQPSPLPFTLSPDYENFYPTSVMETGYDILPWWVCRMAMLGLYATRQVPFKTVYLHGMVRDAKGQKMSKSKGNVINPIKMIDLYGADALRFALVFGTAAGNDQSLSEDKIRGMRNFANKLWNIGRFLNMSIEQYNNLTMKQLPAYDEGMHAQLTDAFDKRIITEFNMMKAAVTRNMENYRYSDAAKKLYDFTWHRIADVHLEKNKERFKAGDVQALAVLRHVFTDIVKLLHPFMPFITESLYQKTPGWDKTPLIITSWP